MSEDEVIIEDFGDQGPKTALKTASLQKLAFGYSVERIFREELPLIKRETAQKYINDLHTNWEFQLASDGTKYAVTMDDWDEVTTAIRRRFPEVTIPSWFDSKGHDTYNLYSTSRGRVR